MSENKERIELIVRNYISSLINFGTYLLAAHGRLTGNTFKADSLHIIFTKQVENCLNFDKELPILRLIGKDIIDLGKHNQYYSKNNGNTDNVVIRQHFPG